MGFFDWAWGTNAKKTYDDMEQITNAQHNIGNQALQNAVETANLVGKSAVNHMNLAVDRQWNIDEVAQLTAKTAVYLDAMAATIAAKVAEEILASEDQ